MKKQKKICINCPGCGAKIGTTYSLIDTELICPECKCRISLNYRNNIYSIYRIEENLDD